jgi:site-specific DNA recombinase
MSHMYSLLSDPFYYGYFPWIDPETGEERMIKGNHAPMITEAEYWRAQALRGKKGKQQPKTRQFAFTGLIRCGECNGCITAEEKYQLICDCKYKFAYENKDACPKCELKIDKLQHPKYLHYTYYRCTKKPNKSCKQKTIRVEDMEEQFRKELLKVTIDQDYLDVALDYLQSKQANAGKEEASMRDALTFAFESCQKRLTNLHREYTSPMNSNYELYAPEEFKKQKSEIVTERDQIESQLNKVKEKLDISLEATERTFNFCAFALAHFNTEDIRKKRTIFSTVGSNLTLKDRKLNIEALHPFLLIENELKAQRKLYEWLEPEKDGYIERRKAIFGSSIPNWLRG